MSRIPLLIYSDAPDGKTGLGRIARDLAQHIYDDLKDEFEVATYGYMALGSKHLPWPQYTAKVVDTVHPDLRKVWEDFAGDRKGVLMPIMPPSWIFGLAHPEYAYRENPKLLEVCAWLHDDKPFELWPYLAIESCGPGMKFNDAVISTITKCAKPLLYSRFGQKVAENSGIMGLPYIHHGLYRDSFIRSGQEAIDKRRAEMRCQDKDTVVIGCVATNSSRKRFSLLFAAFAEYQQKYNKNSKLWIHTNRDVADWNIPELIRDYGFSTSESIAISYSRPEITDQWLTDMYSACNVTTLPTNGEGFGFPIVESQFCGVPCVTGSLACEGEIGTHCVGYLTSEVESIHNLIRPHYNHVSFADSFHCAINGNYLHKEDLAEYARSRWSWDVQWPKFKEWLLK